MDELVALVSQKTGLPEDKSRKAAEVVLGFLKDRLPAPIAGQIDNVVSGQGSGGVSGALGGMFGKK